MWRWCQGIGDRMWYLHPRPVGQGSRLTGSQRASSPPCWLAAGGPGQGGGMLTLQF